MNVNEIMNLTVVSFTLGALLTAAITLIVCLFVVRTLLKIVSRTLTHTKLDEKAQTYIIKGLKIVFYVLTAMVVLGDLIDMTSLVALLSVCSLGITLAAEDILGNVAGGLVIFSTHPFELNDYIEADGVGGTVEEISVFHTKLLTPNGQYILVPNRSLSSTKITNYSRLGRRRIAIPVTASYDAPTQTVLNACMDAMDQTPNLLSDPAPVARLTNYGESSIEYTLYCWASADDYWDSYFFLMKAIRDAFEKYNVEMTYNHLNVHVVEK